jgi:hypothetical protein
MHNYLDSSADHQDIFQSDSEDESNNKDVIEPRNKVRTDGLMPHQLGSIHKVNVSSQICPQTDTLIIPHKLATNLPRPNIQTYDKANVSCQAQMVSNHKVIPIAPPDYSPQAQMMSNHKAIPIAPQDYSPPPQCLNTEKVAPATYSHPSYPGTLVRNGSDPTVIQPEHHSELTPPRAEPMADITMQNWTKFSNNVHSLLAKVNTDIREEMNTKF